jgi:hypothetical protein
LLVQKNDVFLSRQSHKEMWQYGKKIIDNLIKRRTKRPPIRAELESRSEANSDRSDIGMFEVGLSVEQYGNYEQGTRTTHRIAIVWYRMESAK